MNRPVTHKAYEDLTTEDHAAVKLWGQDGEEELYHDDLDEAIEAHLDDTQEVDGTVTLCGFVPMTLPERGGPLDPDGIIERITEALDDVYANPNGCFEWHPSERIKEAAQALRDAFHADYRVWTCEPIIQVEVPVRAWIEKHRPDWLDPVRA